MAAVDPGSVCSRFQNAPETIIFSGPPGPGPLKLPFSPDQHKPAPPAQAKSLINFPVPGRRELPWYLFIYWIYILVYIHILDILVYIYWYILVHIGSVQSVVPLVDPASLMVPLNHAEIRAVRLEDLLQS